MISLPDENAANPFLSIELGVADRYLLSHLLPRVGSRAAMVAANQIERLITFTEAEITQYGIVYEPGGVLQATSDCPVEFSLNEPHIELIRQAVKLADEQGRISRDMLPLLDKLDSLISPLSR